MKGRNMDLTQEEKAGIYVNRLAAMAEVFDAELNKAKSIRDALQAIDAYVAMMSIESQEMRAELSDVVLDAPID